jgi:hypothetical protein
VGRRNKEIKVILHPPERGLSLFEKNVNDFYISQIEKRLNALPKEKRLEVLELLYTNSDTDF